MEIAIQNEFFIPAIPFMRRVANKYVLRRNHLMICVIAKWIISSSASVPVASYMPFPAGSY